MSNKPGDAEAAPTTARVFTTSKTLQMTPDHHGVLFVEQTKELPGSVKVVERWVPAKEGEPAQALFGPWGDKIPMRLEGRYINGKRI